MVFESRGFYNREERVNATYENGTPLERRALKNGADFRLNHRFLNWECTSKLRIEFRFVSWFSYIYY